MEEVVNSYYELFMKYINDRPSVYYVNQKPAISLESIKERLIKTASLNRINVFTDSYLTYIMDSLGDYDLVALDNATKEDGRAFFEDIFYYFYRIYCEFINTSVSGESIEDCGEPYVIKLDEDIKKVMTKVCQIIQITEEMVHHNMQDFDAVKFVIISFLTRCYINQEMDLFNDLIDKIALDPLRIADDLRVNGINSDNVIEKEGLIFERITSLLANKSQIL